MQIKIFSINVYDTKAEEELNKFLRSHSIIDIEKYFAVVAENAFWTFCIRYIDGGVIDGEKANKKSKIDYKKVLSESEFTVFSLLRECRKKIAERNAIPIYMVFTNEELSKIAKLKELTIGNLMEIDGIGSKRAEKFGKILIDLYNELV